MDLFLPWNGFGFVGWTVLQLWGLRFRMRIQDHRVTGVYERPRLNASADSSNSSTSHAGSGTFVVPFSDFGGQISCVRWILFFAIRVFGWIQTTLNMLGHMAGRRMERQMSGTLKRNCRGTERDKQTLGWKISCGVHCVCVCAWRVMLIFWGSSVVGYSRLQATCLC